MLIVLEFFVLRLILSGLVNWVCLDLEKNMMNEVHVLGQRFLGLTFFQVRGLMIFLGWFSHVGLGLMIFFMFCRFRWRIGILYEILHCFGFNCSWIQEEHEEQVLVFLPKIMKAIIIIIIKLDLKFFYLIQFELN